MKVRILPFPLAGECLRTKPQRTDSAVGAPCRVLCPTRRTWLHNPAKFTMQTIEEYKAYTKQLENEVGKWHHAYDALMVERNQLARELATWKKSAEDLAQARILDEQQRGKK